jgi:hypothetical protein
LLDRDCCVDRAVQIEPNLLPQSPETGNISNNRAVDHPRFRSSVSSAAEEQLQNSTEGAIDSGSFEFRTLHVDKDGKVAKR